MDGLFVVIAIVIGIFKFAAEQQKKQGGSKQRSVRQPAPGQRRSNIPEPLKKVLMDLENGWNEGLQGPTGEGMQEAITEEEGLEQEDRGKIGSLNYIEQNQSLEGECDEHAFHPAREAKAKQVAKRDMPPDAEEGLVFDITEEELLKSIVMAEVLGPPRALIRRIR